MCARPQSMQNLRSVLCSRAPLLAPGFYFPCHFVIEKYFKRAESVTPGNPINRTILCFSHFQNNFNKLSVNITLFRNFIDSRKTKLD